MRTNLLSLVIAPTVLAAAALTAQPAMAESHVVNVPFNFTVAGKICPAGAYTVQSDNYLNSVHVTGQNRSFVWLLVPGDAAVGDHRVTLTFDVYGQDHLLRAVKYGMMTTPQIDKQHKESIPAAQQISIGQ
jgi:hypothetical protein